MKPEYLYKYRGCSENTFNIIKNNELYFAHPCDFNDPFDTKIVLDMSGQMEKCTEVVLKSIESDPKYAYLSKEDKLKVAILVASSFENPKFNKFSGKEFAEKVASSVSVCCFSDKKDNLVMWSHYADNHKGICLQFMNGRDIFKGAFKVNYESEYPKVNFFDPLIDIIDSLLLTKSKHWEYEDEYRIILEQPKGNKAFAEDILIGIIFGCQMDAAQKEYVSKLVKSRKHPINLYQAKMKDFEFSLDIHPLP
jgi:hypothetical protein